MRLPRLAVTWGGAALLLAHAHVADAQAIRSATLSWDDRQVLLLSVPYRDAIDASIVRKLEGGLPTTILLRASVYANNSDKPISGALRRCRVIFDLWEEVYRVEIQQLGSLDVVTATPTLEGVLHRCGEVERLPLVTRASIPTGTTSLSVSVLVEVNPVSSEMLDRIKRWVSRPSAGNSAAPGDALFGSFVGLFVARIGRSDRQIEFRTPPLIL